MFFKNQNQIFFIHIYINKFIYDKNLLFVGRKICSIFYLLLVLTHNSKKIVLFSPDQTFKLHIKIHLKVSSQWSYLNYLRHSQYICRLRWTNSSTIRLCHYFEKTSPLEIERKSIVFNKKPYYHRQVQ